MPDTTQTRVPRARLATGRGGQGLRQPLRSQPRLRHSRAPCGPSPDSGAAHRPPLQPRPPGRRRSFTENQTSHAPALLKRFWGSQHPRGQAPLAWPLPVSSEGPRPCPLSAGCPTRSHRHLLPRASPHGAPAPHSPWGLRVPTHTLQAFLTPRVPGPAGRSPRANPLSRRAAPATVTTKDTGGTDRPRGTRRLRCRPPRARPTHRPGRTLPLSGDADCSSLSACGKRGDYRTQRDKEGTRGAPGGARPRRLVTEDEEKRTKVPETRTQE